MTKKFNKLFSTPELVRFLQDHPNKPFEVGLCLNGGAMSTHWLNYNSHTHKLNDMGCDSEERKITMDEFLTDELYSQSQARWKFTKN